MSPAAAAKSKAAEEEAFDWVALKAQLDARDAVPHPDGSGKLFIPQQETIMQKFERKSRENPFIPIGMVGTVGFLTLGLYSFHRKMAHRSQLMMRGRILAQGFTVMAFLTGIFYQAFSEKKKMAAKKEK